MTLSRLPLVDLELLAWAELMTNESITTYTFDDGVEHRRPAYWMRNLEEVLIRASDAIATTITPKRRD